MENSIKLATWNLCLGLRNKKDCVSQIIKANKVDICCMQDIDIPANYNHDIHTRLQRLHTTGWETGHFKWSKGGSSDLILPHLRWPFILSQCTYQKFNFEVFPIIQFFYIYSILLKFFIILKFSSRSSWLNQLFFNNTSPNKPNLNLTWICGGGWGDVAKGTLFDRLTTKGHNGWARRCRPITWIGFKWSIIVAE